MIVSLFNLLLADSKQFWCYDVKKKLQSKYIQCLFPHELEDSYNLKKDVVDMRVVISLLIRLTNIRLSNSAVNDLMNNPSNFKFVEVDIKSIDAKLTPFHWVYFADAIYLMESVMGRVRERSIDFIQRLTPFVMPKTSFLA